MTDRPAPSGVLILDQDPVRRVRTCGLLAGLGWRPTAPLPEADWVAQIMRARPQTLVLDGEVGGLPLTHALPRLRGEVALAGLRVIVRPGTTTKLDRHAIYAAGADEVVAGAEGDGALLRACLELERFELTFWGVRGTLPVPGRETLNCGGNTSCVSLRIARDRHFVFDAGTGLRRYSEHLIQNTGGRFSGRIFISHPHWDHLNCLPFFRPLFQAENRIDIHGPAQAERSLLDLIRGQMDGVYFPVKIDEFRARVGYHDLDEGQHRFDGVRIDVKRLRHPGRCLAYRVHWQGRSLAYVTDNELGIGPDGRRVTELPADLVDWLKGVEVLIHETTYFDEEYPRYVSWGHSSIGQVTALAHRAGVGEFFLFHHDPSHGDAEIERKHAIAAELLEQWGSPTRCRIAMEGLRVELCPPLVCSGSG